MVVRALNFTALLVFGTLWSVLLVVGGALLSTRAQGFPPSLFPMVVVLGLTSVCAGQYVFLTVVADRLFPGVRREVAMGAEITLVGLMVAGLFAIAAIWLGVGS